jgi:hypothetical protein
MHAAIATHVIDTGYTDPGHQVKASCHVSVTQFSDLDVTRSQRNGCIFKSIVIETD